MSPEEYLKQLQAKLEQLKNSRWLLPAAENMRRAMSQRIFDGRFTSTGELKRDFDAALAIEGNTVILRLKEDINRKKIEWLEKKYGPVFKPTNRENGIFKKELSNALESILNQ
jgi:hypothetical protein